MNSLSKKMWSLIALGLLLPGTTFAAVFLQDEQALSLADPVNDTVFAAGETVLIDQPITGGIFAAGERVSVTKPVTENIFVAGSIVEINTTTPQDVFAAGNEVTFTGEADDLFAAGSTVTLDTDTAVTGDAFLAGQTVIIAGNFSGNVYVAAEEAVVTAGTTITGTLISGGRRPLIEDNVSLGSQRHHEQPARPTKSAGLSGLLASIVTWFVAGIIARYLFPQTTAKLRTPPRQPIKSFFMGLGWLLLFIPACVLLAVTLIGLPLMFFVLLLTGMLILGALSFTPIIVGSWAMQRITKKEHVLSWQDILLGSVLYNLLSYLPVIGWLASAVLTIWVMGELIRMIWPHRPSAVAV